LDLRHEFSQNGVEMRRWMFIEIELDLDASMIATVGMANS
jgi:hypothetical protein